MMPLTTENIQKVVRNVIQKHHGTGGAIAVVRKGEPVIQTAWGYADLERRIPMTTSTLLPICSISKQMFCMVAAQLARDPSHSDIWEKLTLRLGEVFGEDVLKQSGLKLEHLYNMQSGIRDYWAMTVLWGAQPEGVFSIARDGPPAVRLSKSFHFEPGTEFSYSNVNFHIFGRLLEDVCGESLERLLSRLVFGPASMRTAMLCPNTAKHPPPCLGYEGSEETGYTPADNRIEWSGDAGIVASLHDMIAYENYLESNWSDDKSAYYAMTRPTPTYKDGKPAYYGFGLSRAVSDVILMIGHGGALRGFRLGRIHVPEEHLSFVVLFNHEAYVDEEMLIRQLFDRAEPQVSTIEANKAWPGVYLDEDTQLAVTIEVSTPGKISLRYTSDSETLDLSDLDTAKSSENMAKIESDMVTVERLQENRTLRATRLKPAPETPSGDDFMGEYYSDDAASTFRCSSSHGVLYGSFEGFLGTGPMHLMRNLGVDVWALACPRSMDAPAPGDWTLVFSRDSAGRVDGVTIGCWLARKNVFKKM